MKKIYKNQLPKNMKVEKFNAKIEGDEIVLEIEFKEKFCPNDGDFVYANDSDGFYIFVYNKLINGCYVGGHFFDDGTVIWTLINETDYGNVSNKEIRPASEREINFFIGALEREQKKTWNVYTKKIEKLRWRGKKYDRYYTILPTLKLMSCVEDESKLDDDRYNIGNYFKTEEAAKKVLYIISRVLKNSNVE